MAQTYRDYYQLIDELAQNPRLIPRPTLYDYEVRRIYAAMMAQAATPLADGSPSPFTSQSPATAHARLFSVIAHVHSILGHELDLTPDRDILLWLAMLGVEPRLGDRPTIELEFFRERSTAQAGLTTTVPGQLRVTSKRDSTLEAIVIDTVSFPPGVETLTVEARLNRIVDVTTLWVGDFSIINTLPSNITGVRNTGVVTNRGRDPETLVQTVLRAREGIRAGTLGRDEDDFNLHGRCVTPSDVTYWATRFGALKVNVIDKDHPDILGGGYPDLMSVCVYPPELSGFIGARLEDMAIAGMLLATQARSPSGDPAPLTEIVPITGRVTIAGSPEIEALSPTELFDLVVVEAIAPRVDEMGNTLGINPPGGIWGDPDLAQSISVAIEAINGIYAVPTIELIDGRSGLPFDNRTARPWQLFEIQQGFKIELAP